MLSKLKRPSWETDKLSRSKEWLKLLFLCSEKLELVRLDLHKIPEDQMEMSTIISNNVDHLSILIQLVLLTERFLIVRSSIFMSQKCVIVWCLSKNHIELFYLIWFLKKIKCEREIFMLPNSATSLSGK